jgi:hypothetical protein
VGGAMKLMLMVLFFASGTCLAVDADDVDVFLTNFYSDFSEHKIDRLSSSYFHPGAQAVFGEHVSILSSSGDVRDMFTAILGGLDEKGYKRSVVKRVSKTRLGESYVFVSVLFDRVSVDGNRLDSMCSSYSMVKVSGEWRFLSWVPTEPLPTGTCTP